VISVSARDDEVREASRDLVHYAKGQTIYHQGDLADQWFEVVSGIVRTCRFMADGHRQLTGFFYSQDVFGVDGARHRESAEAVTDVVLRRSRAASLGHGPGSGPQAFERALESARRSIFLFGHRTAANRVAAFLITIAERSGLRAGVQLPMTRSDIADHLNLTLHTVSRTISDFARRGLIALSGRQDVRILDLEGLRAVAGDAATGNGDMQAARAHDENCQGDPL
jgi:CRP/FNR family transcriptional regulator/CRP/FNR family nitrogen fixation transcriptional regulator